jgi:hypothetical protein
MADFSFICPCCGELHKGLPDLAYSAPAHWSDILRKEDPDNNHLDSDGCIIGGKHFFVRCVLEVPIQDSDARLGWGVWVSQSEANFREYTEMAPNDPERTTFGYLANRLPHYPDTLDMPTHVHWRLNGRRPWVELPPDDHPLCRDWHQGITRERAIEFARLVLHPRGD